MVYRHLPLEGADSLRLLRLNPWREDDEISWSLIHTTLANCVPYEALSYAWGSSSLTETLNLDEGGIASDDIHMAITKNLKEALVALRLTEGPRHLWVDAVCIDQANVKERNHQVAQMGTIYANASRVVVWLGMQREYCHSGHEMRKPNRSSGRLKTWKPPNTSTALRRARQIADKSWGEIFNEIVQFTVPTGRGPRDQGFL